MKKYTVTATVAIEIEVPDSWGSDEIYDLMNEMDYSFTPNQDEPNAHFNDYYVRDFDWMEIQ